jgi:hypothetical protein
MHNHASLSSKGSEDSNVTVEGEGEEDEDDCPKYKNTKMATKYIMKIESKATTG